jgi:hypothetical protein
MCENKISCVDCSFCINCLYENEKWCAQCYLGVKNEDIDEICKQFKPKYTCNMENEGVICGSPMHLASHIEEDGCFYEILECEQCINTIKVFKFTL